MSLKISPSERIVSNNHAINLKRTGTNLHKSFWEHGEHEPKKSFEESLEYSWAGTR